MLALPIFPVRLQTSIFGRSELNFRVRNGNGWTLALISTNLLSFEKESKQRKLHKFILEITQKLLFSPYRLFQRQVLIQLLNHKVLSAYSFFQERVSGDPYGNRTHVCGVRGRRLNRLTNGPSVSSFASPHRDAPASRRDFWCTFRDSNPGPTD